MARPARARRQGRDGSSAAAAAEQPGLGERTRDRRRRVKPVAEQKAQTGTKRERGGARRFVKECVAELKKVEWPTQRQLVSATIVVIMAIAVVGLALAALGAGVALAGQRLRASSTPAVVIVEEARLEDGAGKPLRGSRAASTLGAAADRVPEGTLLHVSGARGTLLRVEWGDTEAWLEARTLRRLATPR